MERTFTIAPTLDEIEALARGAFDTLPAEFRALVRDIVYRIDDFPDSETEQEMGLESPFDLLGLYRGTPIGEKESSGYPAVDMIFLYRRPLLDYWCETEEDLTHLIRHVMIHEIGHHFGLSDDDMERIEGESE